MKNQRGQVTPFIILSIFLVAMVVLFFVFRDSLISKNSPDPPAAPVYNFVHDCIKSTGEQAIYVIGQNGGYYIPPENSNSIGIPYFFSNGKNTMPPPENIENEIEDYIYEALPICTKNFKEFEGYNISLKEVQSKVSIQEDKIILGGTYPLTIMKGNYKTTIENFGEIEIPIRLGKMYSITQQIIQDKIENSGEICITCIVDLNEKGFQVSIKNQNDSTIYNIYDLESELENQNKITEPEPYNFRFATEI